MSEQDLDALRLELAEAEAAEAAAYAAWLAAEKAKRKPRPEPEAPEPFTFPEIVQAFADNEEGDARLAIKLLEGRFCLDNLEGRPYRMNCTHWAPDTNREHQQALRTIAAHYRRVAEFYRVKAAERFKQNLDPKDPEYKRFNTLAGAYAKRASAIKSDRRTGSVWRVATAGAGTLGMDGEAWNSRPTLLPCGNCVVDLETGKAYDAEPAHRLLFNLASPVEYHGLSAEAPFWLENVGKIFCRDRDLKEYYGLLAGFAATGIQTKDAFVLYGPGGNNGKSLLTDWMSSVLGGFAGTIPVELLLEEKFLKAVDGPSATLVRLRGLRLAVFSEAQASHRFSMAAVKRYTAGGDRISARSPYATQPIEFPQTHTLLGHTNFIPQAIGNDPAFYDRLRLLFCGARFIAPDEGPEEPARHVYHRIPRWKLDEALRKEAPGILAWFVRFAREALRLGDMPRPPGVVLAQVKDYRQEQDLVGQFLRQCCVPDPEAKVQMKHLHAAFAKWSKDEQGFTEKNVWSVRSLARELKNRPEIQKRESNKVFYQGYRIMSDWQPEGYADNALPLDPPAGEAVDDVPF